MIKAVSICGDEVKLAQRLGVSVPRVVDLILGDAMCTPDEFLALVDIVLDDQRKAIELHEDWIENVRKKYGRK